MLDHPARINAHVVGHHIACQPDAARPGAIAQVDVSRLAAQVFSNGVVAQRVSRSYRLGTAAELLDALAGAAALPHPNEPQAVESTPGAQVEFLLVNLVQLVH